MKTRFASLALVALVLAGAASVTACMPVTQTDAATTTRAQVVADARSLIGQPYKTGGETRAEGGFDCSGLTYYSWHHHAGVVLPRTSAAQYAGTTRITKAQLLPGDLVFYSSAGPKGAISHVALYAGNGKIIQAHKPGVPASEDDLATWWTGHLVGYGRVDVPTT
ncbi:NlpC/P60 family protein [Aquihabitans sp. McL0605]|uniref:NlpC/P60 family protein n=1 Tax=Aquihabitans sp. McL0605 TaxID=3415671 RepID=UPI003CF9AA01